jgi:hypothetical protein
MSLIQAALRISAVEALKGRTRFGDNVLDSEIDAFSQINGNEFGTSQTKPFIAVYTEGASGGSLDQPESLGVNDRITLVLELGIASTMTELNEETGEKTIDVGILATDRSQEILLNIVVRQIKDCLMDYDNEWTKVFRGLAPRIESYEQIRAAQNNGIKLAAHQLKIVCNCINEPNAGSPIVEALPFGQFLSAAEGSGDDELVNIAGMIRAVIGAGASSEASEAGLSQGASDALVDDYQEAGSEITQLTVEGEVGAPHVQEFE